MSIEAEFPDPEVLLLLAPEELAPAVLRLASRGQQQGIFHPDTILESRNVARVAEGKPPYGGHREREVQMALSEALQWLVVHIMVMPEMGANRSGGWMRITRRGTQMLDSKKFESYRAAAAFPKALLHEWIADKVWIALARGDLSDAVFIAFRTVEEAVRQVGGFEAADHGMPLMRAAFGAAGPLTDKSQPKPEQQALEHLFAGAIGSYKNPHSHRTVTIADASEAQEMVLLASHLLRIVDARQARASS